MSDQKPVAWDEPVAWIRQRDNTLALSDGGVFGDDWTPLYSAALAQPKFPSYGDTVEEGAVYWYAGKDGKYYSSNDVQLFIDAKTRALYENPPQWRLDKGDLIPLYTHPTQRKPLTEAEIKGIFDLGLQTWRLGESTYQFARAIERAHGIGEK